MGHTKRSVGFLIEDYYEEWEKGFIESDIERFCRNRLGTTETNIIVSDQALAEQDFMDLIEQYRPTQDQPEGCLFVVPTLRHIVETDCLLQKIIDDSIAVIPLDCFPDGNGSIEPFLLVKVALEIHRELSRKYDQLMRIRLDKRERYYNKKKEVDAQKARYKEYIRPYILEIISPINCSFGALAASLERTKARTPKKGDWESETVRRIIYSDDILKQKYQEMKEAHFE
jgi:hypothetical protein